MNELNVLKQPLKVEEMKRMMEQKGYIEAIVPVELNELLNGDLESFLDLISELATGSVCLMNIDYEMIQVINPYTVAIKVTGDASSVLDWEAEDEELEAEEAAPNLRTLLIEELEGLFDFKDGYTPEEVAHFTFKVTQLFHQKRFNLPIELVMDWRPGGSALLAIVENGTSVASTHSVTMPYTYFDESEGETNPLHQFVDDILALV